MYSRMLIAVMVCLLSLTRGEAHFEIWDAPDGAPVRQGDHIYWTGAEACAVAGNGDYCLAWSDASAGSQDVYVQLYDSAGSPVWQEGGVRLTWNPMAQNDPEVFPAPDNGWLVVWRDFRDSPGALQARLRMQLLDSSGLPQWDTGGISLTPEATNVTEFSLVPGAESTFFVVWTDASTIRVRKFDFLGVPQWEAPLEAASAQEYHEVCSDGAGGVLVFFRDFQENHYLLTRITSQGELPWGGGLRCDENAPLHGKPAMAGDGSGGAWVAWIHQQDAENLLLGQHVNAAAEFLWGAEGRQLHSTVSQVVRLALLPADTEGLFLVWETAEESGDLHLAAQMFDLEAGEPVPRWPAGGIAVTQDPVSDWNFTAVALAGEHLLVSVPVQENTPGNSLVHYYCLDGSGTALWNDAAVTVECAQPGLAVVESAGVVHLLQNLETPLAGGLYRKSFVLETGEELTPQAGAPVVTGIQGNTTFHTLLRHAGALWVAWADERPAALGRMVYLQKMDLAGGAPLWSVNGVCLTPAQLSPPENDHWYTVGNLMLAPAPDGGIYAGWTYAEGLAGEIRKGFGFQRVSPSGELLWGDAGVAEELSADGDFFVEKSFLLASPEGGIQLFGECNTLDSVLTRLYYQHYDPSGEPWFPDYQDLLNASQETLDALYDVLPLADGTTLVIYSRYEFGSGQAELLAECFSVGGLPVWNEPVQVLPPLPDRYFYPNIQTALLDGVAMISCGTEFDGVNWQLRLQHLEADGTLPWGADGLVIGEEESSGALAKLLPAGSGAVWVLAANGAELVMKKHDISQGGELQPPVVITSPEGSFAFLKLVPDAAGGVYPFWLVGDDLECDIRFLHYDAWGNAVAADYPDNGAVLTQAPYQQTDLRIIPDGEGGVLACWNDFRGRRGGMTEDDVYALRIDDGTGGEGVAHKQQPGGFSLEGAYPNPFNPATTIGFSLGTCSRVRLEIYDLLGRRVRTLASGVFSAGSQRVVWDGRNDSGRSVATGVYYYLLLTDGGSLRGRMLLVR